MNLAHKYKPKCWAEVVGQDSALAVLDRLRQSGGFDGRDKMVWGTRWKGH